MKLITSYKGMEVLSPETKKIENSNDTRSLWDDSKNERSFDSFGEGSIYNAWWKCPECGYEWTEPIVNVVRRKKKCPRCRERYLSIINNAPIMKYWDWDKNKRIDPGTLKANSKIKANWKCPECGYEWQDYVSSVSKKKEKCNQCHERKKYAKKASKCFLEIVPQLKDEFVKMSDPNDDVYLNTVTSRSQALWKCKTCGFEWQSSIRSRIAKCGNGYLVKPCPICQSRIKETPLNNQRYSKYYLKYPILNEIYSSKANSVPIDEVDTRYMYDKFIFSCDVHGSYSMTLRSMLELIKQGRTPCPECRKEENNKSLADAFPDLALDWSARNSKTAAETKPYSEEIAHWKCHICGTEWDASVFNRTRGSKKCPKCNPSKKYSERYPKLNEIFDVDANGRTADSLKHSDQKTCFCWKCDKHGAYRLKFGTVLRNLKNGINPCRECRKAEKETTVKAKPIIDNPLSKNHPSLAKEWSEKNECSPEEVSEYSKREAIWRCAKCGNEWKARVTDRVRGFKSCPKCLPFGKRGRRLADVRPDLRKYYSSENDVAFDELSSYDEESRIWICDKGHKIMKNAANAIRDEGFVCPKCSGRIAAENNNISLNYPELLNDWDYEKNEVLGLRPNQLLEGSRGLPYWKCKKCGSSYQMRINRKILYDTEGKISCPYCANRKASDDNNLTVTNPEVLKEWNYEANDAAGINPHNVLARNGIIAHWICSDCGSHYDMAISERVQREDNDQLSCPYCRGRLINETNCLKNTHPELMREWSANENALIEVSATEISDNYNGKAWWICPVCNYKYTMSVQARCLKEKRHQNACPRCNGRLQKRLHFL